MIIKIVFTRKTQAPNRALPTASLPSPKKTHMSIDLSHQYCRTKYLQNFKPNGFDTWEETVF